MEMTQAKLRELVTYNPISGLFQSQAGRGIGYPVNRAGYIAIWLCGKHHLAHRMAWLYVYGECPRVIDHINGDPSDNRIKNLRPASFSQNRANSLPNSNSRHGAKGVHLSRTGKRWRAKISINKRTVHLGTFPTKEQAATAYLAAARDHYGDFARAR